MGLEDRKLKVFVSSSMEEFSAVRATLKKKFDKLNILNFIFEHEGASGQSPGELFRKAVPKASVYIGIFGKTLGRYTEEEYRLARTHDVSCHVYFLKMNETERSEECRRFYSELNGVDEVPTRKEFTEAEELYDQIVADLIAWFEGHPGTKSQSSILIRDNLPVLCDRQDQHDHLRSQVQAYCASLPIRPVILMMAGAVNESHQHFVTRMEWRSLPNILNHIPILQRLSQQERQVKITMLDGDLLPRHSAKDVWDKCLEVMWPVNESPVAGDGGSADDEPMGQNQKGDEGKSVAKYITDEGLDAFFIGINIHATSFGGDFLTPLHTIKEFLLKVEGIPGHVLFGCLVCLIDDQDSRITRWFRKMWPWTRKPTELPGERAAREFLGQMEGQENIHVSALPRLRPPELKHGRAWTGLPEVKSWVQHHRPDHPIRDQDIVAIFGSDGARPMKPLYDDLLDLLVQKS